MDNLQLPTSNVDGKHLRVGCGLYRDEISRGLNGDQLLLFWNLRPMECWTARPLNSDILAQHISQFLVPTCPQWPASSPGASRLFSKTHFFFPKYILIPCGKNSCSLPRPAVSSLTSLFQNGYQPRHFQDTIVTPLTLYWKH